MLLQSAQGGYPLMLHQKHDHRIVGSLQTELIYPDAVQLLMDLIITAGQLLLVFIGGEQQRDIQEDHFPVMISNAKSRYLMDKLHFFNKLNSIIEKNPPK
ncbi:hypothetical protein D3C80_1848860 [compost metagenome]